MYDFEGKKLSTLVDLLLNCVDFCKQATEFRTVYYDGLVICLLLLEATATNGGLRLIWLWKKPKFQLCLVFSSFIFN